MEIDINDLASFGVITDIPPYQLPPEAWSFGHNVRYVSHGVERILGTAQVFDGNTIPPHIAVPVTTAAQTYWLYASLEKAHVFDGTTHTDVTRLVGGDYNATQTRDWNTTILGGVAVMNNINDHPQYWAVASPATPLANLPNWDAAHRCAVMRSHGPHLVALDVIKSGTRYPHMVKWSHPATPGAVPSSWDETDPTTDAGEKDLEDTSAGLLIEGLRLGKDLFLYKESSVVRMSYIGGRNIFSFPTFLDTAGILAPRCVTTTGDGLRHFVVTQDDIIVHNGNTVDSILQNRQKSALFSSIDNDNFRNSFAFTNPLKGECWFCYPEDGQSEPNKALIWNYVENKPGVFSSADVNFRNAIVGPIDDTPSEIWDTGVDVWDSDSGPWSQISRRKIVLCDVENEIFQQLDVGLDRNGVPFDATLRREGLSIIGRKRSGEWIEDHQHKKMVRRVWPKIQGGPVNIRLGSQDTVNGTIQWSVAQVFDPATQVYTDADVPVQGRALGIEFATADSVPWRIDGYKYDLVKLGQF